MTTASRARRGLRCTDPLRTLIDIARSAPSTLLDDAVDRALANRLVSRSMLLRLSASSRGLGRTGDSYAGIVNFRSALTRRGLADAPAPSVLESRTDRLMARHGLPPAVPELRWGPDGEYRIDYAYPEVRLAVEVDGYAWHHSPAHLQRDHARRRQMQRDGWAVLVYTWADVMQRGQAMAAEIMAVYVERAATIELERGAALVADLGPDSPGGGPLAAPRAVFAT